MFRAGRLLSRASVFKRTSLRRGHDHAHGHEHEEKAYFLGLKPGTPSQGFEWIYFITLTSCMVVLVGGGMISDKDDFREWARREALAREKVQEAGGEIEFGKYYQMGYKPNNPNAVGKYADDGVAVAPVLEE